jgi:hypothetical protein
MLHTCNGCVISLQNY